MQWREFNYGSRAALYDRKICSLYKIFKMITFNYFFLVDISKENDPFF